MSNLILPRRQFLIGLGAALAAPAIVRAESLMKVKSVHHTIPPGQYNYVIQSLQSDQHFVRFIIELTEWQKTHIVWDMPG